MPTATVDEQGTYIYYEDTGIPEDAVNYTTVMLLHGITINSGQ